MDLNGNGSWGDAGEEVVTDVLMAGSTSTTFNFPVPVGSHVGTVMSRLHRARQKLTQSLHDLAVEEGVIKK